MVRAKIKIASMKYYGHWDDSDVEVVFAAVYKDDSSHENKQFWKYTPNLTLSMTLSREAKGAIAFFRKAIEEHTELYLDFTEAPAS
jgi:hypothetical protein